MSQKSYNTIIDEIPEEKKEDESTPLYVKNNNNTLNSIIIKILIIASVVTSFCVIFNRNDISSSSYEKTDTYFSKIGDENAEPTYEISISLESPQYGVLKTIEDLPWDAVAEPYRNQIISISSFSIMDEDVDVSQYNVLWNLNTQQYSGSTATIMMNDTGVYSCSVLLTPIQKNNRKLITEIYTYDFTLAVKYIRREIRSLTDEDREEYFSALEKLYEFDESTGQKLYGSKFHSAEYFSYKHLTGAGTTDCDHWHDGAAIITHHMAFTLEFEQSLQSINPAISNPYWEYGMDTYLYEEWSDSPIFEDDWFGESSPINFAHKIKDGGRWEGIKVPDGSPYSEWSIKETGSLNPYINAYGHMRSPWNNNPFQEIARHNETYSMTQYDTMPTCSTLQSCFKSTSMADINECSNGATHGPVHILIGGAWGDGDLFNDEDIEMVKKPEKLLYFKILWRMGWTRCPDSCEVGSVCKCSVPQQYIDEYGAEYILKSTNVYYGLESYLEDADDELMLKVLRAVEDSGITGDMFSSAAAIDPIFWPLHGQIERLLGAKRIMISQGLITDFDETWAFTEYNKYGGGAYLNGVCDWSNVAGSGDLTLPTCTMDEICSGHYEDDVLEFTNFLNKNEEYTNIEFYDFIHPWSDDLPYTYDTWDFDYCADQGYSFTSDSESLPLPGVPDSGMIPGIPNGVPPNK